MSLTIWRHFDVVCVSDYVTSFGCDVICRSFLSQNVDSPSAQMALLKRDMGRMRYTATNQMMYILLQYARKFCPNHVAPVENPGMDNTPSLRSHKIRDGCNLFWRRQLRSPAVITHYLLIIIVYSIILFTASLPQPCSSLWTKKVPTSGYAIELNWMSLFRTDMHMIVEQYLLRSILSIVSHALQWQKLEANRRWLAA